MTSKHDPGEAQSANSRPVPLPRTGTNSASVTGAPDAGNVAPDEVAVQ
jgi:hypothetical protein